MKKKVLIVVPYMTGYGGTETVIQNLFSEYNKEKPKDYHFKLISIGGYEHDNWIKDINDKVIVNMLGNKLIRTLKYMFILPFIIPQILLKERPSYFISTNPIMWSIAFFTKKIFKINTEIISWYHYSLRDKPLKKIYLKSADTYFAISSGIAKQLLSYGIPTKRIKIIFNPINRKDKVVKRSKIEDPVRLIYVGRIMLDGQKNIRQLLDALAEVKGNWQLDLYGAGKINEIKEYANNKGILSKLNVIGFKDKLWDSLEKVDALVLTSKYEGLPMVLNEAISVGIPVISSNCETGPDDIVNHNNGMLYELNNNDDLVKKLDRIVSHKVNFDDTKKIKTSINKFYSDNYFRNFLDGLLLSSY